MVRLEWPITNIAITKPITRLAEMVDSTTYKLDKWLSVATSSLAEENAVAMVEYVYPIASSIRNC